MAASKRDFQDFQNKKEFNFSIDDGVILFPKLYNIDTKDRLRVWQVFITLYDKNTKIDITNNFLNNINMNQLKSEYNDLRIKLYTKSGIEGMKITNSEPTIINMGKNIGKSNETNMITQALIDARSKYLKKIDCGYDIAIDLNKSNTDTIPYPMSLHIYDDFSNKIKYPCYIQPKLDGIRMIAYYDKNLKKIIFKSRKLKDINGFEYIKEEIKKKLSNYPTIFLDGELYCHGLDLQMISGIVRSEEKSANNKMLSFNIFDCFDTNNAKWKFKDRIVFVNKNWEFQDRMCFVNNMIDTKTHNLSVLTEEALNEEHANELYNKYIRAGYEGIVYRNMDGLYKYSYDKEQRSYDNLKRKQQFDSEFEIYDYTTGTKGKSVGSMIFIMKTDTGKTFHVTPNVPHDEQQKMYQNAQVNFTKAYKGKMATIKYDDLSKDGIPLRAKWITLRNYE
jgi:hypothetical protein